MGKRNRVDSPPAPAEKVTTAGTPPIVKTAPAPERSTGEIAASTTAAILHAIGQGVVTYYGGPAAGQLVAPLGEIQQAGIRDAFREE